MKADQRSLIRRINSAHDLAEHGLIAPEKTGDIEKTQNNFAIGLSPHLAKLIRTQPDNTALVKQYIPDIRELEFTKTELQDPIGDEAHTPVKGIVHRYPDRVLFKIAHACAVYCRYCFRREMIGLKGNGLTKDEIGDALDYIKSHKGIQEVILTGGDPLILSPRKIKAVLKELEATEHVRIVRIHSRIPIADPERLSEELITALKAFKKPVYLVVHINHSDEINAVVKEKCSELHHAGCTLLSQSVLLRGVNDNAAALENLFRDLIALHIKPYYLHHPDKALGTGHFRLPLKEGMKIYQSLLGRLTGIALPSYMLDIPGGHGKIPINHSFVEELGKGSYRIRDYKGKMHLYSDD
ncbi:MAG: lysine-2,3-aminomutase-like protein [Alphaproteobacteria bacterium]